MFIHPRDTMIGRNVWARSSLRSKSGRKEIKQEYLSHNQGHIWPLNILRFFFRFNWLYFCFYFRYNYSFPFQKIDISGENGSGVRIFFNINY